MSALRIRVSVGLVGAAAAALVAVVLPPLAGTPAVATHPCASGSPTPYDPNPSADHDACTGSIRPAPAQGSEIVLTDADNGRTVTMGLGQRLRVELQHGGSDIWSDVVAENALHRFSIAVLHDRTRASFSAQSPTAGQHVTATTDMACFHSEPACASPQRQWQVTVVIENRPDSTPSPSPTRQCMHQVVPTSSPDTVVVDESADGRTIRVQRGQRIQVAFSGCKQGGVDYQPAVGGGPLFRESASGTNPGGAVSWFRAMAVGTTTVTAVLDAECLHRSDGCAVVARVWQVTIEVVASCALIGPSTARSGGVAQLSGRADPNASVQVWFRQRGASEFVVRRELTADVNGAYLTSFVANDDYRWYATSGSCTTATGLTQVTSWIQGPRYVARGSVVPLEVHGPANASVAVYLRPPGGTFRLARTGRLDSNGTFRTSYVARTDQRYYAVTGPDGRASTAGGLTQVR